MTSPLPIDMVCMTVASAPGIGNILLGAVVPFGGVLSFAAAGTPDGSSVFYYIQDGNNRENAWGIYSATAQSLTRNTISASVNGVAQATPINATANAVVSSLISGGTIAASIQAIPQGGMINKFRNGSFNVWQRGTSIAVPTSGAYTADGWIVVPAGASVTASQANGRGPTVNSLQIAGASGVTDVVVKQRIEGSLAAPMVSGNVTIQAQIENNTGATITPKLTVRHANAIDNWSASTVDVNAVSLQPCANGAWTRVSYSYPDPGFAAKGLEIALDFGNNFASPSQSIAVTECDIRASAPLSQPIVTPSTPELRPLSTELPLCQRYFQSTFGNNVTPGTATINGLVSVSANNSAISFPVPMLAAPTLNYWDGAGNANKVSVLVTSGPSLQYLGFSDHTSIGGTTNSLNSLADIQAGDTVVVSVTENGSSNPAISISDGTNTYTKFIAHNPGPGSDLWYCQDCQPVQNPVITATWSGSTLSTIAAVRMAGMAITGVLDQSNFGDGASISTGILTTQPEIVVVAEYGTGSSASVSTSGWTTLLSTQVADLSHFVILAYRIVTSTASVTFTTTGMTSVRSTFGSFVGGTIGTFINGITPTGALELNESNTGFVSGLGIGAMRNQSALFQYTASAEL